MGYSYSHGQAYGASHDMRQMMPGTSMSESGVKLTPITGRVSRAKKGVPVHTCEMCRPPKTFTRAEHLRRHQLSHQPPDLACGVPGCNKVFHRKDLLERHQQRHEQDERLASEDPRHRSSPPGQSQGYSSSSPSRSMHMGSYGGGTSHSSISSTPRHESHGSGSWSSANRPFGHTLPPPRISASPQQYYAQSPQSRYSADSTPRSQGASPRSDSTQNAKVTEATAVDHKTPEAGHDFYMSDGDQSNSPDMQSSATGSTYSTPSDSSNDRSKRARSSSTDYKSTMAPLPASAGQGMLNAGRPTANYDFGVTASTGFSMSKQSLGAAFPIPGYDNESMMTGKPLLANTAVRALPMPFGPGRSTDVLMAAPALFQDRMISPQLSASPPAVGFIDQFAMQGMPILALSQGVRDAIPVYLEVYWNKVHPMYPIIHRHTFEKALEAMSDSTDVLQCAMAAVATQFLGHEDHRINGSQLHFHAACKLKVVSGEAFRFFMDKTDEKQASGADHWPIETMQAILLSEYYMRFRGRDKEAFLTSDLFKLLYQKVIHKEPVHRAMLINQIGQRSDDALRSCSVWSAGYLGGLGRRRSTPTPLGFLLPTRHPLHALL